MVSSNRATKAGVAAAVVGEEWPEGVEECPVVDSEDEDTDQKLLKCYDVLSYPTLYSGMLWIDESEFEEKDLLTVLSNSSIRARSDSISIADVLA